MLNLFVTHYERGSVLSAPLEMKLPNGNVREPDIIFITHDRSVQITPQRVIRPADLVIEIVSPESVARDRGEKFDEYEEAGVKEYWIIDSRPSKQRADFWVLDATGRYRAALPNEEGVYHSTVLKGFWLNVNWLQQKPPMNPLLAFAYISEMPELIRALEVGSA